MFSTSGVRGEPAEPLPWDAYLRLRKQRRIAGVATTWPTMILAAVGSGSYFMTLDIDPSQTIAGIDPMFVYLGATLTCTGLGWLIGPSFGSTAWSLLHRRQASRMAQRDKQFFDHIRKMRADPTRQVVHNPLPDYYGEKIGSLREYRHWLRKQQIFRRKASHGVEEAP